MPEKIKKEKAYADMGKAVAEFYESGYFDKKAAYKMSFIKGVLGGVGGVIGATIVIALIAWILSLFSSAPLVGPAIRSVQHTIKENTK